MNYCFPVLISVGSVFNHLYFVIEGETESIRKVWPSDINWAVLRILLDFYLALLKLIGITSGIFINEANCFYVSSKAWLVWFCIQFTVKK